MVFNLRMEAKKVYQISLVFCGLLLALSGIACLVVATLLNHDSDLKMNHESRSRTYGTQYWLGLPMIAFGGGLMLLSTSMHRRKTMASLSLFSCIPLITCALAGSILHGTAYTHFLSIQQRRMFLEEHSYLCADVIQDDSTQCKCTKTGFNTETSDILLQALCTQQRSLVSFHGALLTFSVVGFSLLLGILVICVILLPQFLKLQLSVTDTVASGQINEGFSHARGRAHSIDVHSDTSISRPASQTALTINDRPPSYESLLTSFNMTPRNNTSQDTNDTTNVATERNIAATVNQQARVRYRGELNSNQIPRRTDQGETSPNNDLLFSNGLENIGPTSPQRGSIPLNRLDRLDGVIPRRTRRNRQGSHELHVTTNNENRGVMPQETSHQQTALNAANEPRSEQISEPSIETRSGRTTRPSLEASGESASFEVDNSSDLRTRNTNSSAEHPSNNNVPMIRTTQPSLIQLSQTSHTTFTGGTLTHLTNTDLSPIMEPEGEVVRNIRITSPSTELSSDTVRHDSLFMDHTPLGRTVSDNSEDGVYIDITRNPAHRSYSAPTGDSLIAVRHRGQSNSENSVHTQSSEIHEQENSTTEHAGQGNLQETTHQGNNSLNSVDTGTSEQSANYLHNGTAETTSGNIDIPIQDEEDSNGNAPRREGESLSSENDVGTNYADTNSVSSLEIMSI